jgi:hypothetical protein
MTDLLFTLATSNLMLSCIGIALIALMILGFVPGMSLVPFVGAYVPVAKLLAFLLFGLLCALIDRRSADTRAQVAQLQRDLSFAEMQISNNAATAADKARLADASNAAALADQLKVKTYAQWLALQPDPNGCDTLTDDDVRWLRDVQPRRASSAGKAGGLSLSRLRGSGKGPENP